jgi:hypothetical protein
MNKLDENFVNKYRFRLTIGNVFAIILMLRSMFIFMDKSYEGWQYILAPISFIIGLFIIAFDYFIKINFKKYLLLNIVELIVLITLFIVFYDFVKFIF